MDYKTRKQPFEIRHHPRNYDRVEPEVDNILKPLPDDKPQEPEKVKKPVKNFIQKNREKIGKGKKAKDDDKNGTVTLTQDQLNAILASVGKVASGEEDKLKISIGMLIEMHITCMNGSCESSSHSTLLYRDMHWGLRS